MKKPYIYMQDQVSNTDSNPMRAAYKSCHMCPQDMTMNFST